MKWLKRISIIVAALIVISIVGSIVTTNILNNKVTTAQESGSQEGQAQGYVAGYQQGAAVGYQEGSKAGYPKGKEEGYNSGYTTGFGEGIGTGYLVRNPTYDEVQEILAEDVTWDTLEIINNAEAQGIRAAFVYIDLASGDVYWGIAFETVDKGLIFIEPSSHKEVKIETGKRYSELNGLSPPDYDDTITKITIIW